MKYIIQSPTQRKFKNLYLKDLRELKNNTTE